MQHYRQVICELCGSSVRKGNLNFHKNSSYCEIAQEHKAATEAGYVYVWTVGNTARAQWAFPFVKQFNTGAPQKPRDKALSRWWAKEWWWRIYCMLFNVPERIEILEQIKDAYEAGNLAEIDNIIGGLELMKEEL